MQIFRGGVLVALLLALAGVAAPAAQSQQPDGVKITADVDLGDDGLLRVVETVEVPQGSEFRQVLPLRVQVTEAVQRTFQVSDIEATGDGEATVADDRFTIAARSGQVTFKYTVHNTVADSGGAQTFRWSGVLNTDVASISVTMTSPDFRMGVTKCTIGPPGKAEDCADIRVEPDGVAHLEKTDLRKGDLIDVTLQVPPGTVKANADIQDDDAPGPFSLTGPVFAAFGVLLAALAAAGGYVVWARRRRSRRGRRCWIRCSATVIGCSSPPPTAFCPVRPDCWWTVMWMPRIWRPPWWIWRCAVISGSRSSVNPIGGSAG